MQTECRLEHAKRWTFHISSILGYRPLYSLYHSHFWAVLYDYWCIVITLTMQINCMLWCSKLVEFEISSMFGHKPSINLHHFTQGDPKHGHCSISHIYQGYGPNEPLLEIQITNSIFKVLQKYVTWNNFHSNIDTFHIWLKHTKNYIQDYIYDVVKDDRQKKRIW